MKLRQYDAIEKEVNDNPTVAIKKSTYIRLRKYLANCPDKIKIKDFVSGALEEVMDNLEIEVVSRETQIELN